MIDESHRFLDEIGKPGGNRGQGILRVCHTLGPSQMARHYNMCSSVPQNVEGWQKCPDAPIVGDHAVFEWNVGVDTEKHHLTGQVRSFGKRAKSQGLER
jgi:hypothetical protein